MAEGSDPVFVNFRTGEPIEIPGTWQTVSSTVIASDTSQLLIPLIKVYRNIRISAAGVRFVTSAVNASMNVELSENGGSAFNVSNAIIMSVDGLAISSNAVAAFCPLLRNTNPINTTTNNNGVLNIIGVDRAGSAGFYAQCGMEQGGGTHRTLMGNGFFTLNGPINYIKVSISSNSMDLGRILVEGVLP